jgi:hypothetical protein
MPEIPIAFSFRRTAAGSMHAADAIAIYRWRSAAQTRAF